MDRGNGLVAAGATLTLIGLTWGGVHYPWNSVHVLVPLILGLVLMAVFFGYEIFYFRERISTSDDSKIHSERLLHPATLPLDIISNRTSAFGYVPFHLRIVVRNP